MSEFLAKKFGAVKALLLGIPPTEWLIAGIIGIVVWAALWILRNLIAARYKKHSRAKNPTLIRLIAYLIGSTTQIFFFAVALDAAQASLTLPDRVQRIAANTARILIPVSYTQQTLPTTPYV
jgi:hypothetical protein